MTRAVTESAQVHPKKVFKSNPIKSSVARLARARSAHEMAVESLRAVETTLANAVTGGRLEVRAEV